MKKRNINLDLIRAVAVFSVLSVHFFFNSSFYSTVQEGKVMYIATIMRTACMVCVPLFLMLYGYLMKRKEPSKEYYLKGGIYHVLVVYVLATLLILLYRKYTLGVPLTINSFCKSLLAFEHYSWYIEMYIVLYLIFPFVNMIYNRLNKKQKSVLISIAVVLTGIPVLLVYEGVSVVPAFWKECYPLTFYLIGAFLSEYEKEIKIKKRYIFSIYILSIVIGGTYTYFCTYGFPFIWGNWCSWGNFFNIIATTSLFLLILKIRLDKMPNWTVAIVTQISRVSLPLYLISWITDHIVYSILRENVTLFKQQMLYMPVVVLSSFVLAFILAIFINQVCRIKRCCSS